MEAEVSDAAADSPARRVLIKHEKLIELDMRHRGWQIASERAGFVLKVLTGLAAGSAAGVLALMAWNASRADGVVIEPFSVPADLTAQGSSGEALAAAVQDRLARLQSETVTGAATSTVRAPPVATARIVIPQTGVSIAELNQALVDALGHETHIRGEVARVADGPELRALTLRVRIPGGGGVRLTQPDGDLEALVERAAEQVYARLQPGNYLQWLDQHGRTGEAIALAQARLPQTLGSQRASVLSALSAFQSVSIPVAETMRLEREAARLRGQPTSNNIAVSEIASGHDEKGFQSFSWAAAHPVRNTRVVAAARRNSELLLRANRDSVIGDVGARVEHLCVIYGVQPCSAQAVVDAALIGGGSSTTDSNFNDRLARLATSLPRVHETRLTARLLAAPRPSMEGRSEAYQAQIAAVWLSAATLRHLVLEQWPELLADAESSTAMAVRWPGLDTPNRPRIYGALALAQLGRLDEGQARIAATPLDCYACLRVRARVAALGGDAAGADRWFAEAVRQGPSLPFAASEWAVVKLARGDAAGALSLAQSAHKASPRFPDPIEIWGEALLAKGDATGAAAKFSEAAKLAPNWGRLHLKWGEALAKLGKTNEARVKWRAAGTMDLSPADRAALKAHGV